MPSRYFKRTRGMATSPVQSLNGLQSAEVEGGGFDPSTDPLGVALQGRAMQHRAQYVQQEQQKDPYRNPGPLVSPAWEGFQQALAERGVDRIAGGPSAPGSNQLRGQSVQPGQRSLTTYGNAAGQTQESAQKAARNYAAGGSLPQGYEGYLAPEKDMFQRRVRQSLGSLRRLV